ncbi:hypothetical protein GH810_14315 [Acetobacterium paludosum]|uniref:Uncharacterized protein n=1 Tax=Acetobacterium paludosum TaxID=52693 RepID=A0A923HWB4_9FIRM|nr:hypothetical protein [Acetobacterium paludosum]MBC3889486.1 hypothetical protein [Acetobacterium paludosum]
MEKVKFKYESGVEPYLIHNGVRYQVHQDKVDGSYVYQLKSRETWVKFKKCKDPIGVMTRFLKNKKYTYREIGNRKCSYKYNGILFSPDGWENEIKIQADYIILSRNFDNQKDCIEFSKKYIEENCLDQQVSLLD